MLQASPPDLHRMGTAELIIPPSYLFTGIEAHIYARIRVALIEAPTTINNVQVSQYCVR